MTDAEITDAIAQDVMGWHKDQHEWLDGNDEYMFVVWDGQDAYGAVPEPFDPLHNAEHCMLVKKRLASEPGTKVVVASWTNTKGLIVHLCTIFFTDALKADVGEQDSASENRAVCLAALKAVQP